MPIRVGYGTIISRAQFDVADVTNAGDPPLRIRLDDDVAELLGCPESAQRFNAGLISCTPVTEDRRLVEGAGRHLGVLGAKGAQNIAGADVVRGSLVRVDPDAHRILPLAQGPEIRHARKSRDLVFDMENHVVRDIFGAARSIR